MSKNSWPYVGFIIPIAIAKPNTFLLIPSYYTRPKSLLAMRYLLQVLHAFAVVGLTYATAESKKKKPKCTETICKK